jgi:hypothetical protein
MSSLMVGGPEDRNLVVVEYLAYWFLFLFMSSLMVGGPEDRNLV